MKLQSNLFKNNTPFLFDEACMEAFKNMKEKLISTPIMVSLDCSEPFKIMCNASDYPVEVVLNNRKDKIFKAIYYFDKTLNDATQLHYYQE